jgi:hypothetical protein
MRYLLLACLLAVLVGCNKRSGPREDTRVKILEEGRIGGNSSEKSEKDR